MLCATSNPEKELGGGFDSSDDERNPFEQKYNEFGKFVKTRLNLDTSKKKDLDFSNGVSKLSSWKAKFKKDDIQVFPNIDSTTNFPPSNAPDEEHKAQSGTIATSKSSYVKRFGTEIDSFEPIFGLRIM